MSSIEKKEINLEKPQVRKFIPDLLVSYQLFNGEPGLGKTSFLNYICQISPEISKEPTSDDFDF